MKGSDQFSNAGGWFVHKGMRMVVQQCARAIIHARVSRAQSVHETTFAPKISLLVAGQLKDFDQEHSKSQRIIKVI